MQTQLDTKPWYRQFWPWVLIALPGTCIVAIVLTIIVAVNRGDDMVVDNYYKDGKAINRVLDQDVRARELGLAAELSFDFDSGLLRASLSGQGKLPQQLQMKLLHPMEANLDSVIVLEAQGAGSYRGELTERLQHRYHLRLLPGDHAEWRLNGEINFQLTTGAILSAR